MGANRSMSKSKKNVIDPEEIIKTMARTLHDGLCYLTVHQKEI